MVLTVGGWSVFVLVRPLLVGVVALVLAGIALVIALSLYRRGRHSRNASWSWTAFLLFIGVTRLGDAQVGGYALVELLAGLLLGVLLVLGGVFPGVTPPKRASPGP